ncbi:MAG: type II toxin-antitoxin system HicB family antitoxin [Kluyvera sp.]|uniref:type II toxin-antitoxin system HicB family antitoxin n=1 Tax=Kluyvera sp. TaxID=1538228 RepID=UPI003F3F7B57
MMNTMTYKGYAAKIDYSDEDQCFIGRVAGIKDVIGFHADNVADLRTAFEEAVDDYIAYCTEQGREPLRPASGKISLRISPEVHSAINIAAEVSGKSVNQWINDTLSRAAHG